MDIVQVLLLQLRRPAETRPGGGAATLEGHLLLLAGEQLCDLWSVTGLCPAGGQHSGDHHSERLCTEQQQGRAL